MSRRKIKDKIGARGNTGHSPETEAFKGRKRKPEEDNELAVALAEEEKREMEDEASEIPLLRKGSTKRQRDFGSTRTEDQTTHSPREDREKKNSKASQPDDKKRRQGAHEPRYRRETAGRERKGSQNDRTDMDNSTELEAQSGGKRTNKEQLIVRKVTEEDRARPAGDTTAVANRLLRKREQDRERQRRLRARRTEEQKASIRELDRERKHAKRLPQLENEEPLKDGRPFEKKRKRGRLPSGVNLANCEKQDEGRRSVKTRTGKKRPRDEISTAETELLTDRGERSEGKGRGQSSLALPQPTQITPKTDDPDPFVRRRAKAAEAARRRRARETEEEREKRRQADRERKRRARFAELSEEERKEWLQRRQRSEKSSTTKAESLTIESASTERLTKAVLQQAEQAPNPDKQTLTNGLSGCNQVNEGKHVPTEVTKQDEEALTASERQEKRKTRLAREAARQRERRRLETPEQRAARLAKGRARQKALREQETEAQRRKRLSSNLERMRAARTARKAETQKAAARRERIERVEHKGAKLLQSRQRQKSMGRVHSEGMLRKAGSALDNKKKKKSPQSQSTANRKRVG